MRYVRLGTLVVSLALLASCPKPPRAPEDTATAISPEARIQRIPPADPEKYRSVHDYKEWKNPYLFIRKDGVALMDVGNNEQRLVKAEDLPEVLAQLPLTAWPYGRVVAVGQNGVLSSADDAVLIRKNRGIVLGTLESLHILVPPIPPPG
jgi:hypothetical protein